MRFVEEMYPKAIMLENVPSLEKDWRFIAMQDRLVELGFNVAVNVLDAADYKVPQRRKRLIMLASRVHEPALATKAGRRLTVREAFAAMEAPSKTSDKLHKVTERRSQAVRDLIALLHR